MLWYNPLGVSENFLRTTLLTLSNSIYPSLDLGNLGFATIREISRGSYEVKRATKLDTGKLMAVKISRKRAYQPDGWEAEGRSLFRLNHGSE